MPSFEREIARPLLRLLLAVTLIAAVAGCTQTREFKADTAEATGEPMERVLLMPSDVELYLLTTAGLMEPNAAWTQAGRRNMDAALEAELAERGIRTVKYDDGGAQGWDAVAPDHLQLVKLHGAVTRSVLLHKVMPGFALPTMDDRFNWTLGPGVRALKDAYGTDHALFVYGRDSFSSGGRTALIFTMALFGVSVPGGRQAAFLSLVDLETGDIIWFNVLVSEVGDLREAGSARETVEQLLSGAPLRRSKGN